MGSGGSRESLLLKNSQIIRGCRRFLQRISIAFSGIIPVSSRKPRAYPLDMLKQQLNQWNEYPCELRFATNFSTELNRCAEFLQNKLQQATESLKRFNSIMVVNDNKSVQADATALQKDAKEKLETLKNHLTQFQNIQTQFLDKLVEIGKMVGVDFLQNLEKSKEVNKLYEKIIEPSFITTRHGLQINNDGTVYDPKSKLMWKQECELGKYTYNEAIKKFKGNDAFADYNEWRLPTIDELKTLLLKKKPYIDEEAFPNNPSLVWSGSPHAYAASLAWVVNFLYGYSSGSGYRYGNFGVRLVRGGQ
ncbi:MAG: hypothetical protein RIR79_528 [Pseudomonadota bacterium]